MSRADVGREMQSRIFGRKADAIQGVIAELDPEIGRWADEFVFGDVWAGDGLEHEEKMLVAIVALTVAGKTDQLRNYLFGALQAGIPASKVTEAIKMTCVYAGFPSALSALVCWRDVQASHERAGAAR